MNFLSSLFKPNDWIPVWTDKGEWEIKVTTHLKYTNQPVGNPEFFTDYAVFEILYSNSRNRFKLICSGRAPKQHRKYKEAVDKLNEFMNKN